jgi:ribosomal protein S11
MGKTAAETAREVEQTRQQMGQKVSELATRAPKEARELAKRVAFAALTAVAVMAARKLLDRAWTKFTGEQPPNKRRR